MVGVHLLQPIRRGSVKRGYGIDEDMDDENSDTESDEEMEDINLLDVVKGFHTSLKSIQDLRRKYDIALDQLNNLDHNEQKKVLKAYAELEVNVADENNEIHDIDSDQDEYENMESDDDENSDTESDVEEFITELRNMLEKDSNLLDKYVKRAKKRILEKRRVLAEKKAEMENETIQSGSGTKVISGILHRRRGVGGLLQT